MKKSIILLFAITLFTLSHLQAQETTARPGVINSGFYIKLGGSFPVGDYYYGQTIDMVNPATTPSEYPLTYLPARIGPVMDMGFLIYIGKSFANNYLRAGIDATFLTFSFNTTHPVNNDKRYEKYYYYIGQKFGPVISVNPIDRLVVDLSYKINANFAYHFDEWKDNGYVDAQYSKYGLNLMSQEVSINLRYRVMLFGFEYNFGDTKYNNVDDNRPEQKIATDTYRLLIGFKF